MLVAAFMWAFCYHKEDKLFCQECIHVFGQFIVLLDDVALHCLSDNPVFFRLEHWCMGMLEIHLFV